MTKLELTKPKYQASRWTTCCQCHGALDTLGQFTTSITGGVKRDFHVTCFKKLEMENDSAKK